MPIAMKKIGTRLEYRKMGFANNKPAISNKAKIER
jgi:hypothetical protein